MGRLHWALGRQQQALALLSAIGEPAAGLSPDWRTELVGMLAAARQLSSRSSYLRLRTWLEWGQQLDGQGRGGARQDAGRALLLLAQMARSDPSLEWKVPERFEHDPEMFPVVLPIILEAHARMFPQGRDTPEVTSMIETYIPRMQDTIREHMGVRVPGVRIRPARSEALEEGDYLVMLHEVTLGSGNALRGRGNAHRRMVTDGVEPVVRRHLDTFLGHQELARLLQEDWELKAEDDEERARRLDLVPHDADGRTRLLRVLQRLVRQKVPVRRLDRILTAFQAGEAEQEDLHDLLDRVRAELRDELPGADGTRVAIRLGSVWEEELRGWVRVDGAGKRFLAPGVDQEALLRSFLDRVRTHLGEQPGRLVLVVEDLRLRRVVQQLVEGRFPDVAVAADQELVDAAGQRRRLLLGGEPVRVPA